MFVNVVIELALLDISHVQNIFCILKVFFSISGRLLDLVYVKFTFIYDCIQNRFSMLFD